LHMLSDAIGLNHPVGAFFVTWLSLKITIIQIFLSSLNDELPQEEQAGDRH